MLESLFLDEERTAILAKYKEVSQKCPLISECVNIVKSACDMFNL